MDIKDIKDIKVQKKLIHSFLYVVIIGIFVYTGWFLYFNFYKAINWKEDSLQGDLDSGAIVQNINMNRMEEVVDMVESSRASSSPEDLDIEINFR